MSKNKLMNSKILSCLLVINGVFVATSYAPMVQARNCARAVHNPHCAASSGHTSQQSQGSTVIGSAGQSPSTGQTNTHLGSSQKTPPPVVQIKQLVPHKTVVNVPPKVGAQTPPLLNTGMNVPPKVGAQTPPLLNTGMNVPPKVGAQTPPQPPNQKPVLNVYFIPPVVLTGVSKGPPQQITTLPPNSFTGTSPVQQIHPNPPQVFTGVSKGPSQSFTTLPPKTFTGSSSFPQPVLIGQATMPPLLPTNNNVSPGQHPQVIPTPVILTHVASTNLHPDVLLQQQMLHGSATLKSLEPHINNLPVDVYTDKNVHNTTFGESTSIDSNGFHLTMVGVKEATFIDSTPLPVAVNPDDIIFNFNYASAEIHKDQLSQVDKIIAKHSKNGKKIILMGETDGFGSEDYNKHLATLRAHNIIDELKARGANVDDVEIRILVRCCRTGHPTKEILAETSTQRITWVHFQ